MGLWLAVCCTGCDPGSLAYFFMPEAKHPAEMKRLTTEDNAKEVRVVILVSNGNALDLRRELLQSDRQLAESLARQLVELCKTNEEKIAVVSPRKVEEFKNSHPRWNVLDDREIGRFFHADYVIEVTINALSLFEKGSANQLYRGQANLSVALVDVNNPGAPPEQREFSCVYPSDAKGPVPVGSDSGPLQFRQAFLGYVAKRLSWFFSPYPPREGYYVE
jgi:hypothetical protein